MDGACWEVSSAWVGFLDQAKEGGPAFSPALADDQAVMIISCVASSGQASACEPIMSIATPPSKPLYNYSRLSIRDEAPLRVQVR